jgi:hypothetical protein
MRWIGKAIPSGIADKRRRRIRKISNASRSSIHEPSLQAGDYRLFHPWVRRFMSGRLYGMDIT